MANTRLEIIRLSTVGALIACSILGCAPRVEHREFSDDQVGLAALQEEPLRKTLYGPEVQAFVSRYPLFAETVNQEIAHDLGGYVGQYNVAATEPIKFMTTGLQEIDAYSLGAGKVIATVRVTLRLMNYIGLKLKDPTKAGRAGLRAEEVRHTVVAESFSTVVSNLRESKGQLDKSRRVELVKDVIAMAAGLNNVREAVAQCDPLIVEGTNVLTSVRSSNYQAELQQRDAGRAKLLPEIESNLSGTLAGLHTAKIDGEAMLKNAAMWKLAIVDAIE